MTNNIVVKTLNTDIEWFLTGKTQNQLTLRNFDDQELFKNVNWNKFVPGELLFTEDEDHAISAALFAVYIGQDKDGNPVISYDISNKNFYYVKALAKKDVDAIQSLNKRNTQLRPFWTEWLRIRTEGLAKLNS